MNKKIITILVVAIVIIIAFFVWENTKSSYPQNTAYIPTQTTPQENRNPVSPMVSEKNNIPAAPQQNVTALNSIVVYKTVADYHNLVSVALSSDKTKIVAYPGPSDISHEYPTALHNGYFIGSMPGAGSLDGAFLNLDITKYSQMPEFSLTADQLYDLVLDKNPFSEIYYCPHIDNSANAIVAINNWIDSSQLAQMCSKVK